MEINSSLKIAIGLTCAGLIWMTVMSYWTIEASKLQINTADGKEFCRARILSTSSEIKKAKEDGFSTDCSLVLLARKRTTPFDWGTRRPKIAYLKKNNTVVPADAGYTRMIISEKAASLAEGSQVLFMGPIPKPVEVSAPKRKENLLP